MTRKQSEDEGLKCPLRGLAARLRGVEGKKRYGMREKNKNACKGNFCDSREQRGLGWANG